MEGSTTPDKPEVPDKEPEVKTEAKETEHEAEEVQDGATGGGWGGWASGWIDQGSAASLLGKVTATMTAAVEVAKTKSTEAYGLVSKDLEEVSTQALSVVGSTASTLRKTLEEIDEKTDVMTDQAVDSVKKSVSSFWRFASGYAQQMFDEEDLESEALLVRAEDGSPVALDRLQAQLLALSSDPDTYLTDPDPQDDLDKDWKSWTCDLEKRQGEISDLMVNNPHVRKNYSGLVPEKVTHKVFWTRYFYKVHLIELQERKRQLLKARADRQDNDKNDLLDAWDEEDDKKEIPDDLQDRLLTEYERELIASKLKKTMIDTEIKTRDKGDMVVVGSEKPSPIEKDENSSDDWEKLSSGERSPRKTSKDKS